MEDGVNLIFAKGFPLGKTGGLIEARWARKTTTSPRLVRFRWVKPAASLKPVRQRDLVLGLRAFPLGKTGGLIEASGQRGTRCARVVAFPLGKTGGLIEAAQGAA